jgi:Family of unknown function (DUF6640)
MDRITFGRLLLTFVLVAGAVLSFVLDWSPNHLLNPAWHPHARFHGGLLLFLLAGVSATGVWLLWRESKEPEVAFKVAALISLSFWTPLFYVAFLVPGSTPWAGEPGAIPRVAGTAVYPNMIVAGGFLLLTAAAYWLTRKPRSRGMSDTEVSSPRRRNAPV